MGNRANSHRRATRGEFPVSDGRLPGPGVRNTNASGSQALAWWLVGPGGPYVGICRPVGRWSGLPGWAVGPAGSGRGSSQGALNAASPHTPSPV
jgi:hypothetical protein